MAAPWPRVHLYRSLGPVTKESRRSRRRPLPRVRPRAGESQCRSPAGKPLGTRSGGSSRAGDVREGGEQPPESAAGRQDWARGDSEEGAGSGWHWAEPRKQPGGSPARPVLKAPGEDPGRGCFRFRGFLTEEIVGGRPSAEAAAKRAQVRGR